MKTTEKTIDSIWNVNTVEEGQMCPNCRGYFIDDDEDICQICGYPYNHD
ncbi:MULTISPECIES: hypothetical protein [Myroides]|nr:MULTISPECIES: hypothetical protein [Myroides]MDM1527677.1 hypothetical protein [Myroides odoratimimus]MDM1534540.1 hypothetical protein [Myroides marinus]MDM1541504.1 hypothetical protein [Myroides marinus]